jgi:Tfp pilus assembly protein PilN
MIRINLLGTPRPKKGKRAAAASVPGEGPSILMLALIVGVLAVAGNGYWYYKLNSDSKRLTEERAAAEREKTRLSEVKRKYEELDRKRESYKRRVDVIDQLKKEQLGPVNLLATVSNTVNSTDAIWLDSVTDEGRVINIEGQALSAQAIANLMTNLKNTGYFKSIDIKEAIQEEKSGVVQSVNFTLACEKVPPKTS